MSVSVLVRGQARAGVGVGVRFVGVRACGGRAMNTRVVIDYSLLYLYLEEVGAADTVLRVRGGAQHLVLFLPEKHRACRVGWLVRKGSRGWGVEG